MSKKHDGDCTIYAALLENSPENGICTCGYGLSLLRKGDRSEMFSKERLRFHKEKKKICNKLKKYPYMDQLYGYMEKLI